MATEGKPAAIEYEAKVAGKRVTFRRRLTQQMAHDIFGLIRKASQVPDDTTTQVAVMVKVIESWEFEGDPSDPKSYAELDVFDEIIPLYAAVDRYLSARINRLAELKN